MTDEFKPIETEIKDALTKTADDYFRAQIAAGGIPGATPNSAQKEPEPPPYQ